jgi:hypothetical protein
MADKDTAIGLTGDLFTGFLGVFAIGFFKGFLAGLFATAFTRLVFVFSDDLLEDFREVFLIFFLIVFDDFFEPFLEGFFIGHSPFIFNDRLFSISLLRCSVKWESSFYFLSRYVINFFITYASGGMNGTLEEPENA